MPYKNMYYKYYINYISKKPSRVLSGLLLAVLLLLGGVQRVAAIKVGVLLPLHDINGDGRRMVEYYRGFLLACDSLKQEGLSIDINTWNVMEDDNVESYLSSSALKNCDVIFGPLYSKQVQAISRFAEQYGTKVVIPFSINTQEIYSNQDIFQVYQAPSELNGRTVDEFMKRFAKCHPVIIDCADSTSTKGAFTNELRKRLDAAGISYNLTSLKSPESSFSKAFSRSEPNVVILNTARSPELNVAFAKLDGLLVSTPSLQVSMFGYTEWLMYEKHDSEQFHKYDTYIPSTFYYDGADATVRSVENKYRFWFKTDLQQALPRFALTGFDQGYYFLKGIAQHGKKFSGARGLMGYTPLQTPLYFERVGSVGGFKNKAMLLIHYTKSGRREIIRL